MKRDDFALLLETKLTNGEGGTSLRKMAGDLGLSASHLSRILAGKRRVSLQAAIAIAAQDEVNPDVRRLFLERVIAQSLSDQVQRLISHVATSMSLSVEEKEILIGYVSAYRPGPTDT